MRSFDRAPRRTCRINSTRDLEHCLLIAAALDGRGDSHRLAIFGNGAARNIDAGIAQLLHDSVVRQNILCGLRVDELFDTMPHGFCRMRFTAVRGGDRGCKKNFISKVPRAVAMYLLAVTRDTVDSCISIASAMVLRLSGRRYCTPFMKKASCWRTISLATLRIVLAR